MIPDEEVEAAAKASCKAWFRTENVSDAALSPWRYVARAALKAAAAVRKPAVRKPAVATDEVEAAAEALWNHNDPGCSWAEIASKTPDTIAANTRQEAREALEAAAAVRKPAVVEDDEVERVAFGLENQASGARVRGGPHEPCLLTQPNVAEAASVLRRVAAERDRLKRSLAAALDRAKTAEAERDYMAGYGVTLSTARETLAALAVSAALNGDATAPPR